MYYRLKYKKNYPIKIIALVLAAILGELLIWWGMTREESIDLLAGQILHNPWPYAVSLMEDGRTVVGNVTLGFEIILPAGWQVKDTKNPSYFLSDGETIICEINSDIERYDKDKNVDELLNEQNDFIMTYAGNLAAVKGEETTSEGNFIYKLQIPVNKDVIKYTLFSNKDNKNKCRLDFEKIRGSFLYY